MEHLTWCEGCCSSSVRRFGGGNGEGDGCRTCTLLGPEGPDAVLVFGLGRSVPLGLSSSLLVGGGEGYRPYFENYTVDASILRPAFELVAQDDLKDH